MDTKNNFKTLLEQQRSYFARGATLSLDFRIKQLKLLKSLLQQHESDITEALKRDLNKSSTEAILSEIILVTDEIDFIIKHLKNWIRPQKVSTPFPTLWPGKSYIHSEPYGSVLIIGPWNYPFMLIMSPLIGAIAAGNCAVVKPSEIANHTQDIILKLINEHFPPEYIVAVKGGHDEVTQLLQEKFDYIFFTGGTQIGKIIMEAAAKHLTPLTLELGGKSPCIVDESANLDFAARRIAWAKTTNAGQVCIAPDYLYVHRKNKDAFIEKLKNTIQQFYGDDAETSSSYGRIINRKHFDRLSALMQNGKIIFGGKTNADNLYIAPTFIENLSWDDPIMQEEIFGPLLPIIPYDNIEEVIHHVKARSKPLALYLFTQDKNNEQKILDHISFGGGCVNDCIMHVANVNLPFGGVGMSGMGNYHGKFSFETFSHRKSIYKKTMCFDLKLEYPPYSAKKLWWIKQLFKL